MYSFQWFLLDPDPYPLIRIPDPAQLLKRIRRIRNTAVYYEKFQSTLLLE